MKLGVYRHYKGQLYEVIGEAKHSEDLGEYIVYKGLYSSEEFGNNPLWIRSKEMFLEQIELDGKKVPRFSYIGDKKYQYA